MSENQPKVKEIPNRVNACPLCGEKFQEALPANAKFQCPEEGGCGGFFLVKIFES